MKPEPVTKWPAEKRERKAFTTTYSNRPIYRESKELGQHAHKQTNKRKTHSVVKI